MEALPYFLSGFFPLSWIYRLFIFFGPSSLGLFGVPFKRVRGRKRKGDRDRDRDRVDLSRSRGRSLEDLKDKYYRGKDKDKAVASGKDYAPKRVAGFMARLAKKRETGTNASRLIDEETFVRERHGGRRDRSRSRERLDPGAASGSSLEQQMKMAEIVAKYSAPTKKD